MFGFKKKLRVLMIGSEKISGVGLTHIQKIYFRMAICTISITLLFFINMFAWLNSQIIIAQSSLFVLVILLLYLGRITVHTDKEVYNQLW
jgi:hypothetical protein